MLRRLITLLRSVANRTLRLPLSHAQGGRAMIPIDLSGQIALVTGVGDNESFAWFIAKALKAAGAKIVLACHPRLVGIVESILSREQDRESRLLPDGSELKVEKVFACDAAYDTMADVPEAIKNDRRYAKFPDFS